MGMGRISQIVPVDSTVKLGEKDYRVGEFRLIDLAELQRFIDDRHGDPIAVLRAHIETQGADDIETQKALALAYQASDGPSAFVYGEYNPSELDEKFELYVEFIRVALSRSQPEVDRAMAIEIMAEMRPGQASNLSRVVWGVHPVDEIGKLLGWKSRRHRTNTQWPEAIVETVAAYPAYRLKDVYELTISEFYFLRTGGKPLPVGEWVIDGPIKEAAAKRRAWWNSLFGKE